jgi:hypothetical protein
MERRTLAGRTRDHSDTRPSLCNAARHVIIQANRSPEYFVRPRSSLLRRHPWHQAWCAPSGPTQPYLGVEFRSTKTLTSGKVSGAPT